jgi:hypothetical protein
MPLLTIVTGLLEGDTNIVETAKSVTPQLNGKASVAEHFKVHH